jgi:hypothetical protein
MLDMII